METLDNPSYFTLPSPRSSGRHTLKNMGTSQSSPLCTPSRRSFRSLFRSLSGPRLPPSHPLHTLGQAPSIPSCSSDQSEAETDFGSNDMMYYNLPTPPHKMRTLSENDEIPPRYYHNLTNDTCAGRRRHSIGAFYKERQSLGGLTTSMPFHLHRLDVNANVSHGSSKLIELPTPVRKPSTERWLQQGARKKCNRLSQAKAARSSQSLCTMKVSGGVSTSSGDMDDILIISHQHSQVANLWVDYLTKCFEQICKQRNRPSFRLQRVGLDELAGAVPLAQEERMVRVRLQLVVMCPQFLQRLNEQPNPGVSLPRLLQPDRVLAMLLGVNEDAITEQQKTALGSFPLWRRVAVRDKDSTFVGEFLNEAMSILARVTAEQHAARQEKASFSVLPKKVKHGHNKVIILLNEPLDKDDKVKITVNKNGEILDVSSVKKRNPFTLHFAMPDACLAVSMLVGVRVEKNGEALGSRQIKCESRMRELDQLLRTSDNPLDFMCQTLGFSLGDREQLDNFLVSAFQRNLPPHFNLFQAAQHEPSTPMLAKRQSSPEELPTLLHFAARYGLEKLAWQLLECPGGEQACEMRNGADMSTADVAEAAGHTKLASALRGYMQMNEFTSMYCYLKLAAEGNKAPKSPSIAGSENDDLYHMPRPVSETYQVPPTARPVPKFSLPSPPPPLSPDRDTGGYLEMLPGNGRRSPSASSITNSLNSLKRTTHAERNGVSNETYSLQSIKGLSCPTPPPSRRNKDSRPSSSESPPSRSSDEESTKQAGASSSLRKRSREQLQLGVQDELVEIISDFKNNVFTISEVEKLVENWRNRNDVQQSFKEKQEQLNYMRDQYERIQQKMKDDMKRPTPFDRVRNFFRGKKEKDPVISAPEANFLHPERTPDLGQRPPSSLSLHSICSSSSSERMSTMSACSGISMGDSGTHSDPEDRNKVLPPLKEPAPMLTEEETPLSPRSPGIPCYEVPPLPRPVTEARNKSKLSLSLTDTSIQNRPPMTLPRPGLDEEDEACYIATDGLTDAPPIDPQPTVHSPEYLNLAPPSEMPNYMNLTVSDAPPVPPRVPPRLAE